MKLIDSILNFIANKSEIVADKGTTNSWDWIKYADGRCVITSFRLIELAEGTEEPTTGLYYHKTEEIPLPFHVDSAKVWVNKADAQLKWQMGMAVDMFSMDTLSFWAGDFTQKGSTNYWCIRIEGTWK